MSLLVAASSSQCPRPQVCATKCRYYWQILLPGTCGHGFVPLNVVISGIFPLPSTYGHSFVSLNVVISGRLLALSAYDHQVPTVSQYLRPPGAQTTCHNLHPPRTNSLSVPTATAELLAGCLDCFFTLPALHFCRCSCAQCTYRNLV